MHRGVPVLHPVTQVRKPERAAVQARRAGAPATAYLTAMVALPSSPETESEAEPVRSPSDLSSAGGIREEAFLVARAISSGSATLNATGPWAPAAGTVGAVANALI